jgi:hypothetical protein
VTAVVITLAFAVLILGILVLGLLRSHAEILRAVHALGVDLSPTDEAALPRPVAGPLGTGATVPVSVTGFDPSGGALSASLVGESRLTLLAFLSSGCLTCRPIWEAIGTDAVALPGGARPVVVTKGPHEESPAAVGELTSDHVITIMSSEAWADFAVPGSPYFVLVAGTGRIVGEGTAATWPRVIELLSQALADAGIVRPPSRPPARRGAAARHRHVDETLRAAGIEPGHPSLHPEA